MVNSLPITETTIPPRIGEKVYLPGINQAGGGLYEVTGIDHQYGHDEQHNEYVYLRTMAVHVRKL
jgi:hypothetical protein